MAGNTRALAGRTPQWRTPHDTLLRNTGAKHSVVKSDPHGIILQAQHQVAVDTLRKTHGALRLAEERAAKLGARLTAESERRMTLQSTLRRERAAAARRLGAAETERTLLRQRLGRLLPAVAEYVARVRGDGEAARVARAEAVARAAVAEQRVAELEAERDALLRDRDDAAAMLAQSEARAASRLFAAESDARELEELRPRASELQAALAAEREECGRAAAAAESRAAQLTRLLEAEQSACADAAAEAMLMQRERDKAQEREQSSKREAETAKLKLEGEIERLRRQIAELTVSLTELASTEQLG